MSGLAALRAARGRLPVIQTFHALGTVKRRHQGAADSSPPERLALEREVALRATGIVATCRDETTELRSLGVDPGRVRIVPCGVDLELFRPEGPVHERTGAPRVVVVTRLVERKGVAEVIRAVATLDGVELLVAGGPRREELGSDPEARRLRELASALGIGARFHLLGRLDRREVPALIRSADAVACCPWYEPFGIVPLEAMACGVPVVGSAVGGLLDTVLDGVTGVLVPPRQPQAIAEALAPLLADAPLRARYGAAGAVRAHVGYGWDRVAAATASSYRALRAAAARRMVGPAAPLDDAAALPREDGLRLSEARSTT
jgi:glycosyltransferase involved in cell wall biosynthesis